MPVWPPSLFAGWLYGFWCCVFYCLILLDTLDMVYTPCI